MRVDFELVQGAFDAAVLAVVGVGKAYGLNDAELCELLDTLGVSFCGSSANLDKMLVFLKKQRDEESATHVPVVEVRRRDKTAKHWRHS